MALLAQAAESARKVCGSQPVAVIISALLAPLSAVVHIPLATSPVLATTTSTAMWTTVQGKPAKTIWTCSMHPQIREDHPGKCPI